MSITSAMYSATSGLMAQSKALASISSNIANSSTTGFKSTGINFNSYINKTSSIDEQTGGVLAFTYRSINAQGEIQSSSVSTNMAINGEGFFVVSEETADGTVAFTRNGSFSTDAEGYLSNSEGYYLYGWALNANGAVAAGNKGSVDSLVPVNVANIKGTPKATSTMGIDANLPSDADTGDSFTTDMEMFDSLGVSHSITLSWTKTGENTWELDASDPVLSSDATRTTGIIGGFPIQLSFNTDGTLASAATVAADGTTTAADLSALSFTVDGWTTGAGGSAVALNLGTANSNNGLTQHASGDSTPSVSVESTNQDGYKPGSLTGTTIGKDGIVRAVFDNGETRAIYQIPIATFANADGLESVTGTTFTQTAEAGQYQLRTAGDAKAGTVTAGALESSTVELTDEFSRMIVAQQAYSAASKVITTSQDMMDTLIAMKR